MCRAATLVRKPKAKARRTPITTIIIQSKNLACGVRFENDGDCRRLIRCCCCCCFVRCCLATRTIRRICKRFSLSNVQRTRKSKASRQVCLIFVCFFLSLVLILGEPNDKMFILRVILVIIIFLCCSCCRLKRQISSFDRQRSGIVHAVKRKLQSS